MTEDRIHSAAPAYGQQQNAREKFKNGCLERDGIVGVGCKVCSLYLLYWHKSTHTDAAPHTGLQRAGARE